MAYRKNGWEREENRNIILLLYNNNGPLVNTLCCVHKWHYIMHAKWLNLYTGIIDSTSWYITQKSNKGRDRQKSFSPLSHTLIDGEEGERNSTKNNNFSFKTM